MTHIVARFCASCSGDMGFLGGMVNCLVRAILKEVFLQKCFAQYFISYPGPE
jgi:hypothetical protein